MPIRILTIPFDPDKELFQDEELTAFLLNKKPRTVKPEFFQTNGRAYWTVFVDYEAVLPGERQADPGLDESGQLLLQRLKEWRGDRARQEGVPVYIVATNRQLEEVVVRAPASLEALRQISGFGKKKLERHGKDIVNIVRAFFEKRPSPARKPSRPSQPQPAPEPPEPAA